MKAILSCRERKILWSFVFLGIGIFWLMGIMREITLTISWLGLILNICIDVIFFLLGLRLLYLALVKK